MMKRWQILNAVTLRLGWILSVKTLNVMHLYNKGFIINHKTLKRGVAILNSKFTFCIPLLQGLFFVSNWREYLDSTRSVVAPILEIIAAHTNHITCVRFECMAFPQVALLGES